MFCANSHLFSVLSFVFLFCFFPACRRIGCALHSGHVVACAPICECFPLSHTTTRMELAVRDVNSYFNHLLGESGISFHTSSEMKTISLIKEKKCELHGSNSASSKNESSTPSGASGISCAADNENDNTIIHTLPDDLILKICETYFTKIVCASSQSYLDRQYTQLLFPEMYDQFDSDTECCPDSKFVTFGSCAQIYSSYAPEHEEGDLKVTYVEAQHTL